MTNILLFLAIIPIVLIMTYVYKKDRNKEPTKLLVSLFIFGILSCFLTLALTEMLGVLIPFFALDMKNLSLFEILIQVFIGIALIEEFSKWIMAYQIGYKSKEFDEVYDSIVYAVFVALGFAFFENLLYVLSNRSIFVGVFRGILAVPGHACYGLYMGYLFSIAKLYSKKGRPDLEKLYLALSLIVPTILHGIYDYCIFSGLTLLIIFFFDFVILLFIFSIKRLKKMSKDTTRLVINNKFCSNCGNPIKGEFCSNCGKRQV